MNQNFSRKMVCIDDSGSKVAIIKRKLSVCKFEIAEPHIQIKSMNRFVLKSHHLSFCRASSRKQILNKLRVRNITEITYLSNYDYKIRKESNFGLNNFLKKAINLRAIKFIPETQCQLDVGFVIELKAILKRFKKILGFNFKFLPKSEMRFEFLFQFSQVLRNLAYLKYCYLEFNLFKYKNQLVFLDALQFISKGLSKLNNLEKLFVYFSAENMIQKHEVQFFGELKNLDIRSLKVEFQNCLKYKISQRSFELNAFKNMEVLEINFDSLINMKEFNTYEMIKLLSNPSRDHLNNFNYIMNDNKFPVKMFFEEISLLQKIRILKLTLPKSLQFDGDIKEFSLLFGKMQSLKALKIFCSAPNEEFQIALLNGIKNIKGIEKIRLQLNLGDLSLSEGAKLVADCQKLRCLNFYEFTENIFKINVDEYLKVLNKKKNMKEFSSNFQINTFNSTQLEFLCEYLSQNVNLEKLALKINSENIEGKFLLNFISKISKLQNLGCLKLSWTGLNRFDKDFLIAFGNSIANLQNLNILSLKFEEINKGFFKSAMSYFTDYQFKEENFLKFLNLVSMNKRISKINLQLEKLNTITDNFLLNLFQILENKNSLEYLDLKINNCTSVTLFSVQMIPSKLKYFKNLRVLKLRFLNISRGKNITTAFLGFDSMLKTNPMIDLNESFISLKIAEDENREEIYKFNQFRNNF